ncbi:MAG: FprA family A-type flavoprotein [Eggerthellales bacterium]|nr:FprA family A-type flavoprotein [Eggerthellales bacterium]
MAQEPAIRYIGVNDHDLDLFEGQYEVPEGMAYNSYVILDEKVAVMDTVEASFGDEWMSNLQDALAGRIPDYLVVHHMEPDHSSNILRFAQAYPEAQIVASAKAFPMMTKFFGCDFSDRAVVVKDGDTLSLGASTLTFIGAAMIHWPEVVMSFNDATGTLFSADAFGKFGALDCEDDDWACEARRYYFGIVGKYGLQVTKVLKKVSDLPVRAIAPLHGPQLTENLGYYLDLYSTWAAYGVESEGICLCYTSVYGNTKAAVETLAAKLREAGCPKVAVTDLARDDMAEAVEDAFRYGTLVLATTTYNGSIFPFMHDFLNHLVGANFQNRTVAFVENGMWAPAAAKGMRAMLEGCKNLTFAENTVTLSGAVTQENLDQMDALVAELLG